MLPTTSCRRSAQSPELVFRVNRNQIVVNDKANGDVWTVVGAAAEKIDNWPALQKTPDNQKKADPNPNQQAKVTPPVAEDDDLGIRNGRTTVLHVLDNDRAAAPSILVVNSIDAGSLPQGVSVQIAPDRQSLLATAVQPHRPATTAFSYTIDDGIRQRQVDRRRQGDPARPHRRGHRNAQTS